MARNRMIKTDFWDDETLSSISRDAKLTFIGMWNFSDDRGVIKGKPVWLKNQIYPYNDDLSIKTITLWLEELEAIKVILPFTNNNEKYYYIKNFLKHQQISHPSVWRNPDPPEEFTAFLGGTTGGLPEDSS